MAGDKFIKRGRNAAGRIRESFRAFTLGEIVLLCAIACLLVMVAASGYSRFAISQNTGERLLSVLRGANGTFYVPEQR